MKAIDLRDPGIGLRGAIAIHSTRRGPAFGGIRRRAYAAPAAMLATLRRESWTLWVSDQAVQGNLDQKDLEPLMDAVGYA